MGDGTFAEDDIGNDPQYKSRRAPDWQPETSRDGTPIPALHSDIRKISNCLHSAYLMLTGESAAGGPRYGNIELFSEYLAEDLAPALMRLGKCALDARKKETPKHG